jgi:predicted phosphodiesterase
MTKLAVLSDIHGNLPALEAILNDLAQFKIDQVVVAGDVINWGPFSGQVMNRILPEGWAIIRGNNELYILDFQTPRAPESWKSFTIPPWTHRQLDARHEHTIASWPDSLCLRFRDAPSIRVVHGSPRDHWEPIYPISSEDEIRTMLAGVEETTVVSAHTHLPMERNVGQWHIFNPGTVGVPLDGTFCATYMLLESKGKSWTATWRRVPFDYEPIFKEFERLKFVDECGITARLVIEEFRTARLQVHPFIHWHKACFPQEPQSMALLEQFSRINKWDYTPRAYHVNLEH